MLIYMYLTSCIHHMAFWLGIPAKKKQNVITYWTTCMVCSRIIISNWLLKRAVFVDISSPFLSLFIARAGAVPTTHYTAWSVRGLRT